MISKIKMYYNRVKVICQLLALLPNPSDQIRDRAELIRAEQLQPLQIIQLDKYIPKFSKTRQCWYKNGIPDKLS